MRVSGVKQREGTLRKIRDLFNSKRVYGVHYNNSMFSRDYIARPTVMMSHVDLDNDVLELKIAQRVNGAGLAEMEATHYAFQALSSDKEHLIGDLPGFTPEGMLEGSGIPEEERQPDTVTPTEQLYTVDVQLRLESPEITYQEFTIGGSKFTLANIVYNIPFSTEEDESGEKDVFSQHVSLLFGEPSKMYFLSHFVDKKLNSRDARYLLELLTDQNITGKLIRGVHLTGSGAGGGIYPYGESLTLYKNNYGSLIIGNGSGYLTLYQDYISVFDHFQVSTNGKAGGFEIKLKPRKSESQITLFME
jgi:hypothetical protein